MPDVRTNWEKRAAESRDQLSGVLFRGLSDQSNAAFHAWHAWIVSEVFATVLPGQASVLDLGCGYGRLTKVLAECRPDVAVTGQDLSIDYCHLFRGTGRACVCADALNLPFENASLDGAVVVTCLMYADRLDVSRILAGLYRVVKPGGIVLLLDPGMELQRVVACVRGRQAYSPTGGCGFTRSGYLAVIESSGFAVTDRGGNPTLSGALLVPGVARSTHSRMASVLGWCVARDCRGGGYSVFALHRWVLAKRRAGRP